VRVVRMEEEVLFTSQSHDVILCAWAVFFILYIGGAEKRNLNYRKTVFLEKFPWLESAKRTQT
jgi:hypothetical protein